MRLGLYCLGGLEELIDIWCHQPFTVGTSPMGCTVAVQPLPMVMRHPRPVNVSPAVSRSSNGAIPTSGVCVRVASLPSIRCNCHTRRGEVVVEAFGGQELDGEEAVIVELDDRHARARASARRLECDRRACRRNHRHRGGATANRRPTD